MQTDTIHNEDCLLGLSKLSGESVQCCVTSPPYYGLRDYGTAKWEGGEAACDHTAVRRNHDPQEKQATQLGSSRDKVGRDCRKCGAIRIDSQIGLEKTPEEYVSRMVQVFREVRRVLKNDGVLWLNLGDSYAGGKTGRADGGRHTETFTGNPYHSAIAGVNRAVPDGLKPKDLIGIPWMVAFALRADGWYLRQDIIWHKPNPMPESVRDRCTKAHEYLFLLSKSPRYYFDAEAIKEPAICIGDSRHLRTDKTQQLARPDGGSRFRTGKPQAEVRNKRSVWTVTPQPYTGAHFAVMPEKLVEPCILAGSRVGDTVLDPFMGAGTVAKVAQQLNRRYLGFELNAEYCQLAQNRLGACLPQLKLLEQTA
jgi:DNA modification methylase